jgi:tight adherence protein C
VTALIQAQRHGTPLADTLRLQAAEMRDKRAQRIEEKAAKLGTKMIFPIVFCFMPVFFIIILVPALSALVDAFGK